MPAPNKSTPRIGGIRAHIVSPEGIEAGVIGKFPDLYANTPPQTGTYETQVTRRRPPRHEALLAELRIPLGFQHFQQNRETLNNFINAGYYTDTQEIGWIPVVLTDSNTNKTIWAVVGSAHNEDVHPHENVKQKVLVDVAEQMHHVEVFGTPVTLACGKSDDPNQDYPLQDLLEPLVAGKNPLAEFKDERGVEITVWSPVTGTQGELIKSRLTRFLDILDGHHRYEATKIIESHWLMALFLDYRDAESLAFHRVLKDVDLTQIHAKALEVRSQNDSTNDSGYVIEVSDFIHASQFEPDRIELDDGWVPIIGRNSNGEPGRIDIWVPPAPNTPNRNLYPVRFNEFLRRSFGENQPKLDYLGAEQGLEHAYQAGKVTALMNPTGYPDIHAITERLALPKVTNFIPPTKIKPGTILASIIDGSELGTQHVPKV